MTGWNVVIAGRLPDRVQVGDSGRLAEAFAQALEENLGKYDAPAVANSFYKPSDIVQIKFVDIIGEEIEISSPSIVIPGVGTYPINHSENFDEKIFKSIFFWS